MFVYICLYLFLFALNDMYNIFLKSGNHAVNINDSLGRAESHLHNTKPYLYNTYYKYVYRTHKICILFTLNVNFVHMYDIYAYT